MYFAAVVEELGVVDVFGQAGAVDVTERPGKDVQVEAIGGGVVGIAAIGGGDKVLRSRYTAINRSAMQLHPRPHPFEALDGPGIKQAASRRPHVEEQIAPFADAVRQHANE